MERGSGGVSYADDDIKEERSTYQVGEGNPMGSSSELALNLERDVAAVLGETSLVLDLLRHQTLGRDGCKGRTEVSRGRTGGRRRRSSANATDEA